MKVTERLIAWHALTKTVCDKLLNGKATGDRRHKQSLAPFVTFLWLEQEIRKFRCSLFTV